MMILGDYFEPFHGRFTVQPVSWAGGNKETGAGRPNFTGTYSQWLIGSKKKPFCYVNLKNSNKGGCQLDDGVADKKMILAILNESAEMAKKEFERHIEFWDAVLPGNIKSVSEADEYVQKNWVDVYKKYIETLWC
jgi:hypothetical protein